MHARGTWGTYEGSVERQGSVTGKWRRWVNGEVGKWRGGQMERQVNGDGGEGVSVAVGGDAWVAGHVGLAHVHTDGPGRVRVGWNA